jgi:transcriptional regulator GlxA family with amidase domain
MAQSYLCGGDFAKGIIAKTTCRFCQMLIYIYFAEYICSINPIGILNKNSTMKVAILNFEGAVVSSVAGPYDILSKLPIISQSLNVKSKIFFEVDIVNTDNLVAKQPFNMVGNITMSNRKQYDMIFVPAMDFAEIDNTLKYEAAMIKWINKQYDGDADIASMCTGAFALASTGLLDGKRATTHWMGVPYFKQLFPKVKIEDDKVIIDEGRIYTSGAAFSFTSLMIYLIEKFCGRDMALAASKVFMIQIHDSSQHAFSIFNLQHNHEDYDIGRVQDFIEKKYDELLTINGLAEKFNMSSRTFIRKFTAITGNTPLEYIQRVRVEAAKRLLEKGKLTVEQVCLEVGYGDFGFFRSIFKRLTGLTPQEYKKKYGHMFNEIIVG